MRNDSRVSAASAVVSSMTGPRAIHSVERPPSSGATESEKPAASTPPSSTKSLTFSVTPAGAFRSACLTADIPAPEIAVVTRTGAVTDKASVTVIVQPSPDAVS